MGSSFSIVNDTNKPIWVSHGVCKAALFGSIGGVLAVATAGAGAATYAAGAAGVAASEAAAGVVIGTLDGVIMTPAAAGVTIPVAAGTVGGLTAGAWTTLGTVSGLLSAGSGITAGLMGEDRKRVLSAKAELEKKLEGYERIEPKDKYTVNGTLSLVLTAYVVYDNGNEATCDCWTGPTAGSDYEYKVTKYF